MAINDTWSCSVPFGIETKTNTKIRRVVIRVKYSVNFEATLSLTSTPSPVQRLISRRLPSRIKQEFRRPIMITESGRSGCEGELVAMFMHWLSMIRRAIDHAGNTAQLTMPTHEVSGRIANVVIIAAVIIHVASIQKRDRTSFRLFLVSCEAGI